MIIKNKVNNIRKKKDNDFFYNLKINANKNKNLKAKLY